VNFKKITEIFSQTFFFLEKRDIFQTVKKNKKQKKQKTKKNR